MMSHPLVDQIASMRTRRRHMGAVIFVMVVAGGLTLLATAVLQAPAGWFPL